MTALIMAAGIGKRANLKENKILFNYQGKPLFMHSVDLFLKEGFKVVLVINKDDEKEVLKYYHGKYVFGGKERSDSVYNGLKEVTSKHVFIHDAARPFLSVDVLREMLKELKKHDTLLLAKRVYDTTYGKDLNIINREELILAETPQVFLAEKLLKAYQNKTKIYTDDMSLYKDFFNEEIKVIFHSSNNKKITTMEDLKMLNNKIKIGHAYDVHKTIKGDFIYLGGIKIDSPYAVIAHSDGDVLLHAISEAIIGALGLGDLGTHFPDNDQKYKNLASKEILIFVKNLLKEYNYEVVNIDASIYLEKPKLNPRIKEIKENVSKILEIDSSLVNIKAGTNEGVDSIGKMESIASEAVVLIRGV